MFGYIAINEPELKVREYRAYRASYCGLCRSLKKRYGRIGQLTLSYDMTFLALLLTSLYEPKTVAGRSRCLAHPAQKHPYRQNPYFDYAADMEVLLAYYKCMDDWRDDRRFSRLLFAGVLRPKMKKVYALYGEKAERISRLLGKLSEGEERNLQDIDKMAGFFGGIMAELFVCRADMWEEKLRRMGFYFGKFIYLMDAYEDVEEDLRKGRYNPLASLYGRETFEQDCMQILKMMMARAAQAFELLPVLKDAELLRNILYAGVWVRYGQIRRGRKEAIKKHDDRSI